MNKIPVLVSTSEGIFGIGVIAARDIFAGGNVHKTDIQTCRYPEAQGQVPPDTKSRWELIEFPDERAHESVKFKWAIAHWITSPSGIRKQESAVEVFFFFPQTDQNAAYATWLKLKKVWTQHGYFTRKQLEARLKAEEKKRQSEKLIQTVMQGKLKPVKQVAVYDPEIPKARALMNAQLSVLKKIMPRTVAAFHNQDTNAAEIYEHEARLIQISQSGNLDAVDQFIVEQFTCAHSQKIRPPSNRELAQKTSLQPDAIRQRIVRLGLDWQRPRGPKPRS